eukprot:9488608-Pyramimonas_sp.AAC.2
MEELSPVTLGPSEKGGSERERRANTKLPASRPVHSRGRGWCISPCCGLETPIISLQAMGIEAASHAYDVDGDLEEHVKWVHSLGPQGS